jgi:hypothetical protein
LVGRSVAQFVNQSVSPSVSHTIQTITISAAARAPEGAAAACDLFRFTTADYVNLRVSVTALLVMGGRERGSPSQTSPVQIVQFPSVHARNIFIQRSKMFWEPVTQSCPRVCPYVRDHYATPTPAGNSIHTHFPKKTYRVSVITCRFVRQHRAIRQLPDCTNCTTYAAHDCTLTSPVPADDGVLGASLSAQRPAFYKSALDQLCNCQVLKMNASSWSYLISSDV